MIAYNYKTTYLKIYTSLCLPFFLFMITLFNGVLCLIITDNEDSKKLGISKNKEGEKLPKLTILVDTCDIKISFGSMK